MFGAISDPLSLVLHVTQHDGRSLERLLAPRRPGELAPAPGGAIVQASYVHRDPALLLRLADGRIPWAIEPQSHRFATSGFLNIDAIGGLPYAPSSALNPATFGNAHRTMVRSSLEFQARHEPTMYVVPSLPVAKPSASVLRAYEELHKYAFSLNGTQGIPYRPILATAYPGTPVMEGRFSVFDRLADRAWAGVYVQPLQLDTKRDSVEKLVAYVRFLQEGNAAKLNVLAGRPGAFGLLLGALEVALWDCGLGGGDSFSLSRLDRPPRTDEDGNRKGGRARPVYLRPLMSAVREADADWLLMSPALGAQLACTVGECRNGGRRYALERPREHFLHCREEELRELRELRSRSLRVPFVHDRLQEAISTARLVNRVREDGSQARLDFDYLDRWLGVLARVAAGVAAGRA